MTDFGMLGRALDLIRGQAQAREEKKLREKFVNIVQSLRANCYAPQFGSSEYWDAEKMADKGWFDRLPPYGYVRRGAYNRAARA